MVTLKEVTDFWSRKDGSVGHGETMEMIHRLHKFGFADDVPPDAAEYMTGWADAEPGDDAALFAHKTKAALGMDP